MVFFKEDLRAVILGGFTSHSWTQAVIAIPSSFEAPTCQGSKKQTERKVTATRSKKCVFCRFKRKIAYHIKNRYNCNHYLLFHHLGWSRVCKISKGRLIRREFTTDNGDCESVMGKTYFLVYSSLPFRNGREEFQVIKSSKPRFEGKYLKDAYFWGTL